MSGRPSYPVSRLDYDLPPELIAQHPAAERSGSRLLHVDVQAGKWHDRMFTDLPQLLPEQTLIYLNDSKVIPARIHGSRPSGGAVELLYLEHEGAGVVRAVVGSNAKLAAGEVVHLPGGWGGELLEPKALDGIRVQLWGETGKAPADTELLEWLNSHGEVPLPPYIHARHADDRERYQTVYAHNTGSVAAPTAGLHFDEAMLARLRGDGHELRQLTLHVGVGTFAPLRVDDLKDHMMHEEPYRVTAGVAEEYFEAHGSGRPTLAVGTTSLRILHTLQGSLCGEAPALPMQGRTAAFIYPGHGTEAARLLLTNFHLPRSTLLALVYAFGGEDLMREVYAHAVRDRYRFFSYGDCMLIDRGNPYETGVMTCTG
jgi:S-adenosylmethionine:tRNA ribosyltransferase-isomerase